jgi:hypothetical protein
MRRNAATTVGVLLTAAAIAGCGGSDKKSSGVSEKSHREYIAGCTDAGRPKAGCECLYDELNKRGINTEAKFKKLARDIQDAAKTANPGAAVPSDFRAAATACKSKLQ